jgi:hypothetical protein
MKLLTVFRQETLGHEGAGLVPYVDGSHLQVFSADNFDRIACFHMCGLWVWPHMTTGQDGFRDASSKQYFDL